MVNAETIFQVRTKYESLAPLLDESTLGYDAPQKLDRHLRCKIAAQRSINEKAAAQNL
jgi:hypothetical protein